MGQQKAVFLDRDGVINDYNKHVNRPEDLVLFPWAASAIRRLNESGFLVFVVTNQGGVEMGYITPQDLEAIHSHLENLLHAQGAKIDEITYCPHFRTSCPNRKPKPGMIFDLAQKHGVALNTSWMIGDRKMDILAGNAAGCQTIKLGDPIPQAKFNCEDLGQAIDYILTRTPQLVRT